jgi:hypothetical protein
MSKVFFDELGLREPDVNLNLGSGPHGWQTAQMLIGLEKIMQQAKLTRDRKPETGGPKTKDDDSISNFQFPISNFQSPELSTFTSTSGCSSTSTSRS